jgi:hypothetical protein
MLTPTGPSPVLVKGDRRARGGRAITAATATHSPSTVGRRVVRFGGVSWLSACDVCTAFPGDPSGWGNAPWQGLSDYSGGTAPDSHRLPAPEAQFE